MINDYCWWRIIIIDDIIIVWKWYRNYDIIIVCQLLLLFIDDIIHCYSIIYWSIVSVLWQYAEVILTLTHLSF